MLSIADELKTIYKNDILPEVPEIAPKELEIYFPDLDLTIRTDQIVDNSFELTESICSNSDLTFGSCEASMIKFTVADVSADLTGCEFTINQIVNDTYTMPLGTYTVDSCKKQEDQWFKDIVAYDSMKKTDVDVSGWYNDLTFPITVKDMRESLLTYLWIEFEEQNLTNDSVQLAKTISPSSLLGRDVLRCICEINAGFGHITRYNKFKVIQLTGLGLYPSETLYPADDLFPAESGEYLSAGYKTIDYEEYIVEPITKLQIHEDDEDTGVVVGTDENMYVITGNFLLYGKNGVELEFIANNILLQIKNKYYRPHTTTMIGLPYLEVGDSISIITTTDVIETFVFKRVLKGIQALEDEISATGSQKRPTNTGLSTQVEQLKSKTLKIRKDVDGVAVSVTDLDTQLTSEMNVLAGEIELKVDKNGVISAINLSPELIKLAASKIAFEGLVTANNNFKILLDGSMEAVNANINGTITTSVIDGSIIMGGEINGAKILSQNTLSSLYTKIENGVIDTTQINIVWLGGSTTNGIVIGPGLISMKNSSVTVFQVDSNGMGYINSLSCLALNGGTPYTSANTHTQASTTIIPTTTSQGNIAMSGLNAASVNWCNVTFQPLSSSDFRLKYDIKPISKAREFILGIKTKLFRFKDNTEDKKQHSGVLAQELESLMNRVGIDANDSGLIQEYVPRDYKDEGMYGKTLKRVNYTELIPYCISVIQEQDNEIQSLKSELTALKTLLKERGVI